MAQRFALHDCALVQNKSLFVDANILIYWFWPTGAAYWEEKYATVFRQLLRQKNQLCVDFLVISEVINRVLRIEHANLAKNIAFKKFRDSDEGQKALNDIHIILKSNVLNRFKVIGKSYSLGDITHFLTVDNLDLVDKATLSLCQENGLVLLTNDIDFENADIDILSGNPKFLR